MRKHWDDVLMAIYMVVGMLVCAAFFGLIFMAAQQPSRAERIEQGIQEIKEVQTANSKFDTSWIENNWGAGGDEGTIRMIGATVYAREGNLLTLKDETGELWCVEDITVADNDCILLWIVDNHTKDDVTDDVVVKVYTEAHS
ncbi:MAG: hypothetical protein ACI4TK_18265 [Agathobacter sp.]